MLKYINQILASSENWKPNLSDQQEDELIIIHSKLQTFSEFLNTIPNVPKDDLIFLDRSHERWQSLNRITEECHKEKAEQVKKNYFNFMSKVAMSQAFVSQAYEEIPGTLRYLMMGLGSMFYFFSKKKSLQRTYLLYARPRLEIAIHVWNLLETKMIRNVIKLLSKSIKFNKVIYIPRTVSEVTKEYNLNDSDPSYSLKQDGEKVVVRILKSSNISI